MYEQPDGYRPGLYRLHYKCRDCRRVFVVAGQRGPIAHALGVTFEEMLLLHAMDPYHLFVPHFHEDGSTGTARLVGLKPKQNAQFYALFLQKDARPDPSGAPE